MRKSDLCIDVPLAVLDDDIDGVEAVATNRSCSYDILSNLIRKAGGTANNIMSAEDTNGVLDDQCDYRLIDKLLTELDAENNNKSDAGGAGEWV